jgi:hypothetical protein
MRVDQIHGEKLKPQIAKRQINLAPLPVPSPTCSGLFSTQSPRGSRTTIDLFFNAEPAKIAKKVLADVAGLGEAGPGSATPATTKPPPRKATAATVEKAGN